MKWHVLVGFFIRFPTPWKRRPNSFADDVLQVALISESSWLISWQCFNILPESSSITAKAALNIPGENFRPAKRFASPCFLSKKHAVCNARSNSAHDFERVLCAGP